MIIINPGTEKQSNTTEENAINVAQTIIEDTGINGLTYTRGATEKDSGGWYNFIFSLGGKDLEVDIPGVDPKVTTAGTPFYSPRLYVDGSSWLYDFGISQIKEELNQN